MNRAGCWELSFNFPEILYWISVRIRIEASCFGKCSQNIESSKWPKIFKIGQILQKPSSAHLKTNKHVSFYKTRG